MPHAHTPPRHAFSSLTRPPRFEVASGRSRSAGPLLLFTACLLLGAADTPAQNVQHTKNTPGIGMRSIFKVNPATNALELQVPLGPTSYPQRGGASAAPAVNYSSRIWRVGYAGATYGYNPGGPPPVTATLVNPKLSENSRMGWTYSLEAPYVEKTVENMQGEFYDAFGNSLSVCTVGGTGNSCCFIDRLRIHMPGGGTQEFRSSDHPVCYDQNGNAPQTPPDLYSVDGSRMRYNRTSNRLYLPDGSYWVLASGTTPAQLFDRNGNRLLDGFTDGLGRTFPNPLDPALGTDYTYTAPGVGGAMNYTFRWLYLDQVLTVPQPLPNYTDMCGDALCSGPSLFKSDTGASPPIRTEGGSNKINPLVLHQIVLPTGQAYTFTYNVYAEIDKVVYPTGGYERFTYGVVEAQQSGSFAYNQGNRGVKDRFVSVKGDGSDEVRWQYGWTDDQGQLRRGEISPDGTRTERGTYPTTFGITFWGFTDIRAGRPSEERVYNSANQLIRRRLSEWEKTGSDNCYTGAYSTCTATRNPRLTKEVDLIIEPGGQALAKITTYGYDLNDQYGTGPGQTSVSEYDYVPVSQSTAETAAVGSFVPQAPPLRRTETTYLDAGNSAYRERHILGLPTTVKVKDGAGALMAESTTGYDEPAYQLGTTYGTVANWADPGSLRGNATTAGRWLNTGGTYVQAHAQYDQLGNAVAAWDANGNQTQTAYSPAYSYAYPTSVTTAAPNPDPVPNPAGGSFAAGTFGSTAAFTSYTDYDPSTGLVTSQTDVNGRTTGFNYSDPLNRLKRVDLPDGGRTTYNYVDAHQCGAYVETHRLLDPSGRELKSWQFFDGLGRPYLSETYENQDPPNVYLRADMRYDAMGRVSQVSNPYRSPGCGAPANPSGQWTTTEYDALGRVKKVTTPDGAAVTTSYAGNTVTVTDQAGRKRSSVSDALGRLAQVTEDPGGLNYLTAYTYDALGNLRKVDQGGQLRFFMYDSLSRLIRAKNPEQAAGSAASNLTDPVTGNGQWSAAYGYDANGNLTARVDARGVWAYYTYDRLGRNIITHYEGGGAPTPDARHHYDNPAAGKNGLGRLWWNSTDDSATGFGGYDAAGRVLEQHQIFLSGGAWSARYSVKLEYNLAGGVTRMTYPSGHAVKYNYDAAGRAGDDLAQPTPQAFTGDLGDGVARAYAEQVSYSEFGGLRQERFGTQTPLRHKKRYNARGQLYNVRLGTGADADSWNRGMLTNHYGSNDFTVGWGQSGPDNNGNVLRTHHYVPSDDQVSSYSLFFQDYKYDALNRLEKVTEWNGTTGQQQYVQAYGYDRWGNRTVDAGQSWGAPEPQFELNPQANREVPEPSNRLYAPGDAGRAPGQKLMRYDAAGNLVFDAYTGAGGRTYDAENRMTAAADGTGNTAYYTYDADGRRVRRIIANEEWWQVYGAGGELLAEYRAGAATFLPSKEYGYRGGELLVTMSSGDDRRLKRFVTNLYYGALRRDPTAQELQDTTNHLAAAGAQGQGQLLATAKQVVRALFTQTSYETSPYRTETQYVTDLYYAYLQRAPEDSGLSGWAAAAAGGATNRGYVCDAFQESGEFSALVSTLYGGATSDGQRTEAFVNRFHLGAYSRAANAAELQQWLDTLNAAQAQGLSQTQAAAEALGRALFAGQVNDYSLTDQQYVTNLYEGFLQRGPDTSGLNFWTSNAAGGAQNRQNVLNAFATSPAFRELAGTLYRETFWLVSDHLGTPRMVVDRTGSLAGVKRHDYLPFGEELHAGTGGRTPEQGYKGDVDGNRKRWAQLERDDETGLDYAQNRYYSSTMGRFTGPDQPLVDQWEDDPPSWNLYAYAGNNPLKFIDPTGLAKWVTIGDTTYFVGEEEGEYNKDLDARWVVDKNRPGGGYWNFLPKPLIVVYDPMLEIEWKLKNWSTRQWGEHFEQNDRERKERNQDWLRDFFGDNSGELVMTFIPAPKFLRAFPGAKRAKPKTPVQGGGGLRKRWKDKDGNIYEWDSQHGSVEKYNKRGKHLGEFDPETGAQTKPADPTRQVEP